MYDKNVKNPLFFIEQRIIGYDEILIFLVFPAQIVNRYFHMDISKNFNTTSY